MAYLNQKIVDDLFFELFCEKNSDGTRNLRLHGREIFYRFRRRLNQDDMPALAQFLKNNQDILSLNLAYNDIGNEGIKIIAEQYFDEENNLLSLNLLHCDIEAEGMKSLSFSNYLKLKSLRLVGNKLGLEGARLIGILIDNCPTLKDLDIGETDQTLESIESLLMVIEKSSLKSLNISRIIPSSFYSTYNISALADDLGTLLKINSSLEVLRIQKCGFDGHDTELILGGLRVHRNLLMLDLSANNIGDGGIKILAEWCMSRPRLIGLKVAANNIGNIGAQMLGLSLPFTRIRLLDLQHNKISEKGLTAILGSIRKSTPIRILYLWGNSFSSSEYHTLNQLIVAGVLDQEYLDMKIYYVDGVAKAAHYPTDHFRHKTYSVYDYGFPPELKIVKNEMYYPDDQRRTLINVNFDQRFPALPGKDAKSMDKLKKICYKNNHNYYFH